MRHPAISAPWLLAAAAGLACAQSPNFEVILIDFGDDFAPDRQIPDVNGVQDVFNFTSVENRSMGSLTASPSGNWWTLRLDIDDGDDRVYVAGSGTTGRIVLAESTFSVESPTRPTETIPEFAINNAARMHVNDSGLFALVLQFFPDFITGDNSGFSTDRRGDRVITGDAGALGDTTVDLLAGEGQPLSDFFTSPDFDPAIVLGQRLTFVDDSLFGATSNCGPGDTTTFLGNFSIFGVDNNGGVLLEVGINGPGTINDGEGDQFGAYYQDINDCRLRLAPPQDDVITIQGFGGPSPILISRRNITVPTGSPFPHGSDYAVFPAGPGQDSCGTSFSSRVNGLVSPGVFDVDQLVKDDAQLLIEGQQFISPDDPTVSFTTDSIESIGSSFTTPLGDVYARVNRNFEFTFFELIDVDFQVDPFCERAFVSDESDDFATKEIAGYGLLTRNGEAVAREGDPITPGNTRTWDDPNNLFNPNDPNGEGGLFLSRIVADDEFVCTDPVELAGFTDRDGNSITTFIDFTGDGVIPIGAVRGNRRGDVIYAGEVDDQNPATQGTFAYVLNEERVVLQDGEQIEIDAVAPFGSPETYFVAIDPLEAVAGDDANFFVTDDGYLYLLTSILTAATYPDFSAGLAARPGGQAATAFIRFKIFDVLDIDRNGTIEPAVDFAELLGFVQTSTPGKGDFNLDKFIDAFDYAVASNDFAAL
ncbi:MAG: hypothetical protein AAGI30_07870 [Planctomycetota bacterium]